MISELISALFHQRVYSGSFWEEYKQRREINKIQKQMLREQDARHKLLGDIK